MLVARANRFARMQPAFDKSKLHYMGRGDKYRHGLAKEKRMFQVTREQGWNAKDVALAEELLGECHDCDRARARGANWADEWRTRWLRLQICPPRLDCTSQWSVVTAQVELAWIHLLISRSVARSS